jgi:hypothetical protein
MVSTRVKLRDASRKMQCHRGDIVGEGGVGKSWWAESMPSSSSPTRLIDVTWLDC